MKWAKLQPLADVKHGPLAAAHLQAVRTRCTPGCDPRERGRRSWWRLHNHDVKILPTDVRAEMAKRKSAYQQQVDAKDGGSGGKAGGRARCAAFTTAAAGGEVCDEASVLV